MIKDKKRIEEVLYGRESKIQLRPFHSEKWSKPVDYDSNKNLLYKSQIIDGLKIITKHITITFETRKKFHNT